MAKKKLLLNESVTRRFMKLAELKPTYVSNFLKEAEEGMEEEDEGLAAEEPEELEAEEEPVEDEGMEMDEMPEDDMEEGEDEAEDIVMDFIKNAVAPWAEENGVSMDIAGDEEGDMEDEEDDDMMDMEDEAAEEPEMEMGGEEEPEMEMGGEDEAEANRGYMQEVRRTLQAANVSVTNDDNIVNEVVKRVAQRLLRESQQRKAKTNRRTTKRRR